MAANRFGIDVGQFYRDVESVKGARTRNKLASLQLAEAEREVAERPKKEAEAKQRNVMLTGLRQKAVTGDTEAQQQLLAIDPEGGAKFIDAVTKMDEQKLQVAQRNVDDMGRMAATVLNAAPERQPALYKQMLAMLPNEAKAKMPKEFDQNFVELSLSKAVAMDKILENPKAIQVGGEDIVFQRGKEIARGKRPAKSTGTDGGLKSADESLMYRQAAELMGGMFDEAGNLRALDPEVRPKVQAIATRASEIFRQGGVTRSQAVSMAAEEVEAGQISPNPDNDPLGIR